MRLVVRVENGMARYGPQAEMLYQTYEKLARWYLDHGVVLATVDGTPDATERVARMEPEAVLMWSYERGIPGLKDGPWRNIYQEQGWFPQVRTFYIDGAGVCGAAMRDLEPEPVDDDFRRWRDALLQEFWASHATSKHSVAVIQPVPSPPYVLVMGQVEADTSLEWSPIHRMHDLVRLVLDSTDLPVVFRPHPSRHPAIDPHPRLQVVRYSPLYPTIEQAAVVVGCTSTALLESALIGRPTLALGKGVWPDNRDVVRHVRSDELAGAIEAVPKEWSPQAAWPWLNALRQAQIDIRVPVFDYPRNRKVLLG